jgi:hypothetical protein
MGVDSFDSSPHGLRREKSPVARFEAAESGTAGFHAPLIKDGFMLRRHVEEVKGTKPRLYMTGAHPLK